MYVLPKRTVTPSPVLGKPKMLKHHCVQIFLYRIVPKSDNECGMWSEEFFYALSTLIVAKITFTE
jgi:hypothetical protein